MPVQHPAGRRRMKAEFLRSQIVAPADPGLLLERHEWQFLCVELQRVPTINLPRSRSRSAEQTLPLPATPAKLAARLKQLPPAAENSRSCDSLGQSCASSAPCAPHTIALRPTAHPVPALRIHQALRGPVDSNCVNRARQASLDRAAKQTRLAADPALLAEIENPSASHR